jgi:hypothetical protein
VEHFEAMSHIISMAAYFRSATLKVLTVQPQRLAMRLWRHVVSDLFTSPKSNLPISCSLQEAITLIENTHSQNANIMPLIDDGFCGTLHCEAFLASIVNSYTPSLPDLENLKVSVALIGRFLSDALQCDRTNL